MLQIMIEIGDNQLIQMFTGLDVNVVPMKRPPKRNPWGNSSYADLITQAIEASPEKKLTLSQIYEWMIRNVPYFSNQGSSNSSAGWKNSIRHNLSLHEKFLRIKNEDGTNCKSSWWTVNKFGGTGKTTRRKNQSRKKKTKATPASQKANSFCRKFTGFIPTTEPLPAGSHESRHSNVFCSTRRRWQSCLSTSSEENESLYSVSSCNSSSSIESEIRDSFYNLHAFNPFHPSFRGNQTINGLHNEFATSIDNAYLHMDVFNYDLRNAAKGVGTYYTLENKIYPNYNYQQNSTSQNYLDTTGVQDYSPSRVSREYFKSPHHLSGSYMTSELAEDGRNQISSADCANPNFPSAEIIDDQTPNIQDCPVLTTCLSEQDLHTAHETQKLSDNLYNSHNSTGGDNKADLDIFNQNKFIQSSLEGTLSDSNSYLIKTVENKQEEKNQCFASHLDGSNNSINKQILNKEDNISCGKGISNSQILDNATDQNYLKDISQNETNKIHDATKLTIKEECLDLQPTDRDANNLDSIKINTHNHSQFSVKEENGIENAQQLNKLKNQIGDNVYYDSLQTILKSENPQEEIDCITNIYQTESSEFCSFSKIEAETSYECPKSNTSHHDISEEERSSIKSQSTFSKKDEKARKRGNVGEKNEENIKRHKLEVSEKISKDEKAISCHIQNKKCPANNLIDEKREVYDKLWSLMTKMVRLVLQKAGNISSEKQTIDHILNKLSLLSHIVTLKQFFSILIEFACALESTYVEQFVNVRKYHSLNQSLELLLRDKNKKCLSFIDAIDLYLNLMSRVIKLNFCEYVLNDAEIKAMDFPLDLNGFLTMYQANVASAMNQREYVIPMTHLLKVSSNESCEFFVFPSIGPRHDSKVITPNTKLLNNDNELSYPHYFQESCTAPVIMTQTSSLIPFNESSSQHFLDPNSSDLVNDLQCGIQDDITSHSSNIQLCFPPSSNNQLYSSMDGHLQQDCSTGYQPENGEDVHAENYEPQNDADSNHHDSACGQANDNVMDDILPDDLKDIEMLYDCSLTEYPEFEFNKNDFDFDMYLKENGENIKNRQ